MSDTTETTVVPTDDEHKQMGCANDVLWALSALMLCLAALGLFIVYLSSSEAAYDPDDPPMACGYDNCTPSISGAFSPGDEHLRVPLASEFDTEVNTVGPCALRMVYDNTDGYAEFATADQHNRERGCYLAVSVNQYGYYTDWEVYDHPGESVVVRADLGARLRGVAFMQCYTPTKEPPSMPGMEPDANLAPAPPLPPTTAHTPVPTVPPSRDDGPAAHGCYTVWRPLPGLAS